MIDNKIDDEAQEFKKIYNHFSDKRTDIMKIIQFKVDVFGDVLYKEILLMTK